jgi:DNA-binding IclR family transcriptional regulator
VSVLDVLATCEVAMSARQVADAAGLDRTVTHRALRTLEMDGLVRRTGLTYALGDRALVFRNAYLRHSTLRHAALPFQIDLLYTRRGVPVAGLTLSGTELEPFLDRESDVAARLARTAKDIGNRLP